jgi:hypothetical protein
MMGATARLERYYAYRLTCEELEQFASRQLAAENHRAPLVSAMRMENVLRDIQTDCGNL